MPSHFRRLAVLAAVFAGAAALLATPLYRASAPTDAGGPVQYGDVVHVPLASNACASLLDPARGWSDLHLFVSGLDTGVAATSCHEGLDPSVSFTLRRVGHGTPASPTEEAAWDLVLGHPLDSLSQGRLLQVDVGRSKDAGTATLSPPGATLLLHIFGWWAPLTAVGVVFVWALMIYLGVHSTLVRDAAPDATPLACRTYSLGKTQFAWWFAIIFASIAFLWIVTGELPALSPQALALMGMSGVTTGMAQAVAPGRLVDDGQAGVFFHDLISDAQGATIHRFQMVVMTIGLGLAFLYDVVTRLSMPSFDPSLLTAMGLSAATYVGLKIPEKAAAPAASDPKAGYTADVTSALPPVGATPPP